MKAAAPVCVIIRSVFIEDESRSRLFKWSKGFFSLNLRDTLKSITVTFRSSKDSIDPLSDIWGVIITLLGLMSLWHIETSFEWRYSRVFSVWNVIYLHSSSGRPPQAVCSYGRISLYVFRNCMRGWPSTRSITRYIVCFDRFTKASIILMIPGYESLRRRLYSLRAAF